MDKLLAGTGLKYIWQKIKNLFGQTFIEIDGVIDVKNPVKGTILKEDYDRLSKDEKKGVYIVEEPNWETVPLEIQEYDTIVNDCDWHVRKWSNGYCELSGMKVYPNVAFNRSWNNMYVPNSLEGFSVNFPIILLKKYSENVKILRSGSSLFTLSSEAYSDYQNLDRIDRISFACWSAITTSIVLSFHVTGCWK